ncbi:MAG: DmsC/YnfH family molybdoenzyme membrane anchor subunit [Rhodocyclaceae bacterium]|nr:DmsC/YnfH family molybdoenzyme membrane anchor subunit [Rhodocyclaceae bacterium]
MTADMLWGFPVIGYLFLAGAGAGAATVSASVLLRGGGFGQSRFTIARFGALIAPLPTILGTLMIVFELGAPLRALNLFKVVNRSPMSIGSWVLVLFIVVSLAYAAAFLVKRPEWEERLARLRIALAWAIVPLGLSVCLYTGILLGAMPSRPFWNTPLIPILFTLSALSAGIACLMIANTLYLKENAERSHADVNDSEYLLATSDAILLGGKLFVVPLLVLFAWLAPTNTKYALATIMPGGSMAWMFWGVAVIFSMVLPFVAQLAMIMPRLLHGREYHPVRWMELSMATGVLIGGLALRYAVVVTGQASGPVGL